MTRQKHSIDGFVPRRSGAPLEGLPKSQLGLPSVQPIASRRELKDMRPIANPEEASKRTSKGSISRSEIDESLKGIDSPDDGRAKRKKHLPKGKVKKIIIRVLIVLIVIAIGVGAYIGFRTLMAGNKIFKGNVFDILQSQPLKMDANGRTNILVLGTSEDDPGHDGANLTDSMMILSVDQNKKNAYMFSIPRDMQVKYGELCSVGSGGKINAYFFGCAGGDPTNVEATQAALKKEGEFVGDIFGLDIQYGVNVNYTVMRDLVKAVGGSITVTIESRDPRGQMDSNFDWKCGVGDRKVSRAEVLKRCPPNGHFIDYKNGPVTLDAEHALYLAQARGDLAPTYGFEQSNFDREKNQQKIVKALREKAFSAGVLADVGKVVGITEALGNNLRTTFEKKEIRTLVTLAQSIKNEDIKSLSLIDGDNPVMNGDGNPAAGQYQYDAIRAFIKQSLSSDPVTQENAKVAVYNGSGVTGAAQKEADKLEELGFVIGTIATAPAGEYGTATIYQLDTNKKATAAKLKKTYGVEVLTTKPPVTVPEGTAFVVIIGKAASTSQTAQ